MKIAINLLTIIPGKIGGIETYANKTIEGLQKLDHNNEYILFTNSENNSFYSQYTSKKISTYPLGIATQYRLGMLVSIYFSMPLMCKKLGIDLLFSPGNIAPFICPCKSVVSILDAVYPEGEKAGLYGHLQRFLYSLSASGASDIITISKSAAQDIAKYCHADKDKITITQLGYGVNAEQQVSTSEISSLKQHFGFSNYLLSLGSLIDRKNYLVLIEAFAKIKDKQVGLIIVGHEGPAKEKIEQAIKNHSLENRVIITGYFNGSLEVLYKASTCYIQPSYYEGFGLPILEAMALSVPVISSDASSLPEVGGNAVLYFKPHNATQLTTQINKLLEDKSLQSELVEKGLKQAALFSWENNAQIHMDTFN